MGGLGLPRQTQGRFCPGCFVGAQLPPRNTRILKRETAVWSHIKTCLVLQADVQRVSTIGAGVLRKFGADFFVFSFSGFHLPDKRNVQTGFLRRFLVRRFFHPFLRPFLRPFLVQRLLRPFLRRFLVRRFLRPFFFDVLALEK